MEKCFCHFNGYKVKDADARRMIEEERTAREKAVADAKQETAESSAAAVMAAERATIAAAEAAQYAGNVGDIFNVEWENGAISLAGGAEYEDDTSIRSGYIPILNGSIGIIVPDGVVFDFAEYNSNLEFTQMKSWDVPSPCVFEELEGSYARINAYYRNDGVQVTPELGELITVYAQRAVPCAVRYDEQTLTPEQQAQARKNINAAPMVYETDEKYFGITGDGLLYLKPEYRGAGKENTPYSVSDNGVEVNGSKNAELPEDIIIPEIVNEIAVVALADGMFRANNRVKSITFPACIIEIPEYFCYMARGLKAINGTENVRVMKGNAFGNTAIEKVSFPSLELLDGDKHFYTCGLLISADLGSKITAIPNECMNGCYRLSALRNAQNVTSVGAKAFYRTPRLMDPAFLPKLTSVGDYGFMRCRVVYDWKSLTGCAFGTKATALQTNPTDFWSECAFSPCDIPMRSTFSQRNPAWADATVDNLGTTYSKGCITVCSAMVYSVLEGKEMASPQEFIDAVRAANPSVLDVNSKTIDGQIAYWNALGYTVNRKNFDAENLQLLYNTLEAGTPVIVGVLQPSGNHTVVVHGINEKGEVLVADPESTSYYYGDYRAMTYTIAVQNLTAWGHDFFFPVKK